MSSVQQQDALAVQDGARVDGVDGLLDGLHGLHVV